MRERGRGKERERKGGWETGRNEGLEVAVQDYAYGLGFGVWVLGLKVDGQIPKNKFMVNPIGVLLRNILWFSDMTFSVFKGLQLCSGPRFVFWCR